MLKKYKQLGDLKPSSTIQMAIKKLPPNLRDKCFCVDDKDKDWRDLLIIDKRLARIAFFHVCFSTFRDDREEMIEVIRVSG